MGKTSGQANPAGLHQHITNQNIVQFVATCMDANHVFTVTELVEVHKVEDMIYSPELHVDRDKLANVAVDVSKAVAYLHEYEPQTIHEDIKPANIPIDRVHMSAKLCDLGLAKARSFDVASTTSGVHAVGTPSICPLTHC